MRSERFTGQTRPVGRVALLLGLVVAAAITLRGRIPEVHRPGEQNPDSPASLAGVITLLAVSVLIMAVAFVASLRNPLPELPEGTWELPRGLTGPRAPLARRLLIAGLGLAAAWLLALAVANWLYGSPTQLGQQSPPAQTIARDDSADQSPAPARPQPQPPDSPVLFYLEVTTAALVMITLAGTAVAAVRRHRRRREGAGAATAVEPRPVPSSPAPLAVAAERGLAEVGDLNRGPREAIIACYAAMEQALASSPTAAPLASDTPTEVLERAVGNRALRAGTATALVDLFAEARFSRHEMSEAHRAQAERVLRSVLEELRATV
ncbi:MAG: DUF4129 domain-containing protein [Mycobacterium sp.]